MQLLSADAGVGKGADASTAVIRMSRDSLKGMSRDPRDFVSQV
jgi:hypothetical protein